MEGKGPVTRAFMTWLSQSSISFAVVDVGHDLNYSMHGPLPRTNQNRPNIIASPLISQVPSPLVPGKETVVMQQDSI